ncbi:hypothetical protein P692DRAFT_20875981 [Suillus brevipes Sb2]|nr:hypothetical protein P692DRAFT_20875981 [Suillus brevipes Sb2]
MPTPSRPTGHNSSPASPALKATGLGPLQDVEEDLFAQLPEITPDMTTAIDTLETSHTLRRLSAKNMPHKDRVAKFLSSQPLLPLSSTSKRANHNRVLSESSKCPTTLAPLVSTASKTAARKMAPDRSLLSRLLKPPTVSALLASTTSKTFSKIPPGRSSLSGASKGTGDPATMDGQGQQSTGSTRKEVAKYFASGQVHEKVEGLLPISLCLCLVS